MLTPFSNSIFDKIIPKEINPLAGLSNLGKIKEYMGQAKLGAIILFSLLGAILIALIVLMFKRVKK